MKPTKYKSSEGRITFENKTFNITEKIDKLRFFAESISYDLIHFFKVKKN